MRLYWLHTSLHTQVTQFPSSACAFLHLPLPLPPGGATFPIVAKVHAHRQALRLCFRAVSNNVEFRWPKAHECGSDDEACDPFLRFGRGADDSNTKVGEGSPRATAGQNEEEGMCSLIWLWCKSIYIHIYVSIKKYVDVSVFVLRLLLLFSMFVRGKREIDDLFVFRNLSCALMCGCIFREITLCVNMCVDWCLCVCMLVKIDLFCAHKLRRSCCRQRRHITDSCRRLWMCI